MIPEIAPKSSILAGGFTIVICGKNWKFNDSSIKIKINGTFTTTDDDTLYKLTECIIDEKEDTVSYKGVDYSKDDFNDWVNESPSTLFKNFETFMNLSPETQAELKFKCKCGKIFTEVETGVLRFLV